MIYTIFKINKCSLNALTRPIILSGNHPVVNCNFSRYYFSGNHISHFLIITKPKNPVFYKDQNFRSFKYLNSNMRKFIEMNEIRKVEYKINNIATIRKRQ